LRTEAHPGHRGASHVRRISRWSTLELRLHSMQTP
jgi:hypothetical protein